MACLYKVVKAMKYVYESYDIDQFIGGVTEYPGLCSAPHSQISSQISLRIWGGPIATSTMSINPSALVQVKLNNRWNSSLIFDSLFQFSCYNFLTIRFWFLIFLSGQLDEIQKVSFSANRLRQQLWHRSNPTEAMRTPHEYEFFK
jgi:hypothetical protein